MPETVGWSNCFTSFQFKNVHNLFSCFLMFGHFIKHNHRFCISVIFARCEQQTTSMSLYHQSVHLSQKSFTFFWFQFGLKDAKKTLAATCLFSFNGPLCVRFFALTREWDRERIILRPLTRKIENALLSRSNSTQFRLLCLLVICVICSLGSFSTCQPARKSYWFVCFYRNILKSISFDSKNEILNLH